MVNTDFMEVINPKDTFINPSIRSLMEFSNNKYYPLSQIIKSHGSPSHEVVLRKLLYEVPGSICTELPIWLSCPNPFDHYLTGHLDLMLYINKTIYICDYKPEETHLIDTNRTSYSFMRSIPQITSYALIIKEKYNINSIMCVTFNKNGAWIYEPEDILYRFNRFIKEYKIYKSADRPWERYFF